MNEKGVEDVERELTVCPFCGNHPEQPKRIEYHWAVYCPCCEFYGPHGDTEILAKIAWEIREESKNVLDSYNRR